MILPVLFPVHSAYSAFTKGERIAYERLAQQRKERNNKLKEFKSALSNNEGLLFQPSIQEPKEVESLSSEVLKQSLIEIFFKNPDIFLGVESAVRGKEAWEIFKDLSQERKALESFDFSISLGFIGLGGSVPINSSETNYQYFISQDQKAYNHVFELAEKITNRALLCPLKPFECSAYSEKYKKESQFIGDYLKEIWKYGKEKVKEDWPIKLTEESLQVQYPERFNLILSLKNAENQEKTTEIIKQYTKNQHKKHQQEIQERIHADPVHNQREPYLQAIEDNIGFFQTQLQTTKGNITKLNQKSQLTENEKTKLKELHQQESDFERTIESYDQKKRLYLNDKHFNTIKNWSQAGFAALQTAGVLAKAFNVSEDVQDFIDKSLKIAPAVQAGLDITQALNTMLISGIDPTGITTISNGINIIAQVAFDFPSQEQIMLEYLSQILENQRKMFKELARISDKLDNISDTLEDISNKLAKITDLIKRNHVEIQVQLKYIVSEINFGFDEIKKEIKNQTHNDLIREAKSLYSLYYLQENRHEKLRNCKISKEECNLSGYDNHLIEIDRVLGGMNSYSSDLVGGSLHQSLENIDLFNKEIEAIYRETGKNYENIKLSSLGVIKSLGNWLIKQVDRIKIEEGQKEEMKNEILELENKGSPYFHDELFAEFVNLSMVLPTYRENLTTPYIEEMCNRANEFSEYSEKMRKYLYTTWSVYLFYMEALYTKLENSFNSSRFPIQKKDKRYDLLRRHSNFSVFNLKYNKSRENYEVELDFNILCEDLSQKECLEKQKKVLTNIEEFYSDHCMENRYTTDNKNKEGKEYEAQFIIVTPLNPPYREKGLPMRGMSSLVRETATPYKKCTPNHYSENILETYLDPTLLQVNSLSELFKKMVSGIEQTILNIVSEKWEPALMGWGYLKEEMLSKAFLFWDEPSTGAVWFEMPNVEIFRVDYEDFIATQKKDLNKQLQILYGELLDEIKSEKLIENLTKARLALNIIVQIGYGNALQTANQLNDLDKLLNSIQDIEEPDIVKDIEGFWNSQELQQIASFLDSIEENYLSIQKNNFILPIPLEEAWDDTPVGFGFPQLRYEASKNAFDYLGADSCLL